MSKILRKLKNRKGETLVESMAAILVFTFASIIMLSMVSAAADINTTAKEADRDFQDQMVVVERGSISEDNPNAGVVRFSFGSVEETVPVNVFQANDSDLYAYYAMPNAGDAGGGT